MPTARAKPSIYQLKITLLGVSPPIWRRVQVPSTIPLSRLHDTFQAVMGWTDSHLHQFERDGLYWAVPDPEAHIDIIDESRVPVRKVLAAPGDWMIYLYDFGDGWQHRVVLEKILPSDAAAAKPVCMSGKRRCPPEDVGGPHGYREFLEVIFDPEHKEFSRLRYWAGGEFHAEEFDVEAVNKQLERIGWPARSAV